MRNGRRILKVQSQDHRVMVRGAIRVYLIKRVLLGGLEGCVVIQHIRFVRVDMPVGRAGDLGEDTGVGNCMVEVASLPIECIGVSVGTMEVLDEVCVIVSGTSGVIGTGFDRINGLFLGIGV